MSKNKRQLRVVGHTKIYGKKFKIEINKKQLIRLVTEDFEISSPICEGLAATDGKQICLNVSNCKKTLKRC